MATVVAGAVWAGNTSLWLGGTDAPLRLLSHRGVHQTYAGPPPGNDTCTAAPVLDAGHALIENTLPSMRAAFDAGAEVVELDVHLTPDGVFAVFHDWTLDCRTDGTGQTNQTPWPRLQELDIGYRYSVDGATYPLRGQGIGLMPRLDEVLAAFPDGRFLINFKSNRLSEGKALVQLIADTPGAAAQVWGVYGGPRPTDHVKAAVPGVVAFDKPGVKACLLRYVAAGWAGFVPGPCRDTAVIVPINVAPWLWGWPHRLTRRMQAAGTEVILVGPYGVSGATAGIDTPELWSRVPGGFGGLVWTNRIEAVAP